MIRRAACCCGKCTIDVEGDPSINAVCHCDNCRKRTGSAFGWSSYFSNDQIRSKSGEYKIYVIDGKDPQQRFFCAVCGSTLFWQTGAFPDPIGITGGCFVDTPLAVPSWSATDNRRHVWIGLPDGWRRSP